MPELIVERYLNTVLRGQLKQYHLSNNSIKEISSNIRIQMISLLAHWDDEQFKNGVLVTGMEEGTFYEPLTEVNPFVVATIRNSLLETYHCRNSLDLAVPNGLPDHSIQNITRKAIEFFAEYDLSKVANETRGDEYKDVYGEAAEMYPIAWTAMRHLGSCTGTMTEYPSTALSVQEASNKSGLLGITNAEPKEDIVVLDGYSDIIDPALQDNLDLLKVGRLDAFFAENFKMVSRNFGKLLRVIDAVLVADRPFVTFNYYISNGYVEKRAHLLRATHGIKGRRDRNEIIAGSRGKLREALKYILHSYDRYQ